MTLNFPSNPADGEKYPYTDPITNTTTIYVWRKEAKIWTAQLEDASLDGKYVEKAGDDMTGDLTVGDNPGISTNVGCKLSTTGFIGVSRSSGSAVFNIYKTGDSNKQVEITSNGIINLATDKVTLDGTNGNITAAGSGTFGSYILCENNGIFAQSTDSTHGVFVGKTGSTGVIANDWNAYITGSGNITATGDISNFNAKNKKGVYIGRDGYVTANHTSRGNLSAFSVQSTSGNVTTETFVVAGNGTVTVGESGSANYLSLETVGIFTPTVATLNAPESGTASFQCGHVSGSAALPCAQFGYGSYVGKDFTPTTTINRDGSASLYNITFNLEPDNDDNYTVTTEEYTETEYYEKLGREREVTKTREVKTYTGPTLDVKEELLQLRETVNLMTAALQKLGVDTSAFPAPE